MAGARGDQITLSTASRVDTLILSASAVIGDADRITNFQANDRIDLSGLAIINRVAPNSPAGTIEIEARTAAVTTTTAAFFDISPVNISRVGSDSYLYVDINRDGTFNATQDYSLQLVGVQLNAAQVIF